MRNLIIDNANIIYKHFGGNKFNKRTFTVKIEDLDLAENLINEGWKLRAVEPSEYNENLYYMFDVTCRFDKFPPNVQQVIGGTMTVNDDNSVSFIGGKRRIFNENDICELDHINLKYVKMQLNPSHWVNPNGEGVTVYLKDMYFVGEQGILSDIADLPVFNSVSEYKEDLMHLAQNLNASPNMLSALEATDEEAELTDIFAKAIMSQDFRL